MFYGTYIVFEELRSLEIVLVVRNVRDRAPCWDHQCGSITQIDIEELSHGIEVASEVAYLLTLSYHVLEQFADVLS